jgi:hypothetical protein
MNAEEKTIGQILTESLRYEIPPYQRPYSWNQDNVRELLEDVEEAFNEEDPEYFIGSLITIERERNVLYEVVDGQQRLTTLNLIFARLRDHIDDPAAKQEVAKRILPSNPLTGATESPRLKLRAADHPFFHRHVLQGQALPDEDRRELDETKARIMKNVEVIDGFFAEKSQSWLKAYASFVLSKVFVVLVGTESFKSAYRLFNVLNDRGMSLSNADLIKNQLFAKLDGTATASELEEKWVELENIVGIDRLDTFLGYHRTSLTANKARKSLADEFEDLIKGCEGTPLDFLEGVIRSAKNYRRIMKGKFDDTATVRSLAALRRVSYDEWVPAMLAFLNKPVADMELAEFADLMERVTMQNWVRRLGRTKRLTIYFQLIMAINRGADVASVRKIFVEGANNEEFFSLLDGDIYGLPSAMAILLRLEEGVQDTSVTKTFEGRITIEHVLPQALKEDYWKERFTVDLHGRWLHRLGNLMPLAGNKNYKAQYFDFNRKKTIYERRNDKVSFDLSKEVCAVEDWNEAALKARQQRMIEAAREIWTIA